MIKINLGKVDISLIIFMKKSVSITNVFYGQALYRKLLNVFSRLKNLCAFCFGRLVLVLLKFALVPSSTTPTMSKLVAKIPLLMNGKTFINSLLFLIANLVVLTFFLAAKPKLREFNRFARTELYPPTPADIPQIISGFGGLVRGMKNGKWKELSVKEAWVNYLITIEVICWFYVGEVIGKRHVRGYDV